MFEHLRWHQQRHTVLSTPDVSMILFGVLWLLKEYQALLDTTGAMDILC
jgi:hypothetical protein